MIFRYTSIAQHCDGERTQGLRGCARIQSGRRCGLCHPNMLQFRRCEAAVQRGRQGQRDRRHARIAGRLRRHDLQTSNFDGDTLESDYIKIEGILNGALKITVKEGQPIRPEWTGENEAEDIAGNGYVRVEGERYAEEEAPRPEPLPDDAVAA